MILPVVLYGAGVLREVAEPIDQDYPNIKELIDNMFDTVKNADGIGLAAPQIGHSIRLFILDISPLDNVKGYETLSKYPQTKVFINAQIVEYSDDDIVDCEEGCLSLPALVSYSTNMTI